MNQDNTVDLGVVQIHKNVIGDIAAASIKEVAGVQLATFGIIGSIAEAFGYKNYPSVMVTVDKDAQVSLEIRVIIHYGMNIPVVALADTNCDPDGIDFMIPGNDDSLRSLRLVISCIAEAVLAGQAKLDGDAASDEALAAAMADAGSEMVQSIETE